MRAAGPSSSRPSRSAAGSCATSTRPRAPDSGSVIHQSLALPGYPGAMLHLLPESTPERQPLAYAEAVSRLASIRHALRLVEPFAGGPASDPSDDEAIASGWHG